MKGGVLEKPEGVLNGKVSQDEIVKLFNVSTVDNRHIFHDMHRNQLK